MFEHLLFLESENLGKGGLDKLTRADRRIGCERIDQHATGQIICRPFRKDALEKMLWAEADKLGWFINTVTDPVLAKEKQVVKNEKRQSVDNNPYGHTSYVIDKALYPADHPYNWQVIGSLEDLENATLEDVKEFFRRWYVPNNVTLVVAGDFDTVQAKKWVEKYFSEIKRGPEDIKPIVKRPGVVKETSSFITKTISHALPELTMSVADGRRLSSGFVSARRARHILSRGKKAPFYQVLVEDKKLTSNVSMFNSTGEVAGQMNLSVRAFDGKDLDEVAAAINEGICEI